MMCLLGCSCSYVFASLCKPACEEKLKNLHVLASDSYDARNFAEAVLHTVLNSFHAVLSCRSAWLNRSLLFSLCKWIQMMCFLAQPSWQLAGKETTFGNYNNAIHHKQWTIVISAKTIQPNCSNPKRSKGNGKWRWMPWRQWKATPLTLFQGRSCKIKFIVAGVLGLDEESDSSIRQTGSCFWTVPTGSRHVKWLVGEFVLLEGICWDILFILT